ncbi:RNA polymerase ECF family sigma subunit [Tahibacter aquaticus]|uniref:RNA polymerase ECF family sigma subunit n=1 Tax=Tahibacter aquaticus TaxID=520092 RepID=A0A4R6YQJ6_9GAMM|nr:RNA polymerase sigma factor [Tahibacter aquaticus]TDR39992.1 RNA polymerase ECF family sigma subunit [Tahibacter aquaticus]
MSGATHKTIATVWRMESTRLIGGLMRLVRDISLAEDLAQDALVAALEQWPQSGAPDNPGAWLMAAAKHRAIDRIRRNEMSTRKHDELGQEQELRQLLLLPDSETLLDDSVGDDVLRLIFIACHPVLSNDARVALTLRLIAGLSTDEIARAFLASEATIAQRIVRAKRSLTAAKVPFEVPAANDLAARLASVLGVIYLVFNEGYAATAGDDWMRPQLCEEALRLGRVLGALMPQQAEVQGLLALMEIQASRMPARTDAQGDPILLLEQDRARWNRLAIRRGLAALGKAEKLGGAFGPYALQAAIAACHARATVAADTDWPRIAALYDALAQLSPSPVIELNRAMAVAMAFGAESGLAIADALLDEPALANYHWLPSLRADLLFKLGRRAQAADEFRRAAALTRNAREQAALNRRAVECEPLD